MRLVAIDLETTGTTPGLHQILEIAMVCFEGETGEVVGEFETLVRHETYRGDPYALSMPTNSAILRRLAEGGEDDSITADQIYGRLVRTLRSWGFSREDRPHAVGFNVGSFDLQSLKAARANELFRRRAIECGSLLMVHYKQHAPVTSKEFMELDSREVAHTALEDCYMAREAYMLAMGIVR